MGDHEIQMTDADQQAAHELTKRGVHGVVPALMVIVGIASMGGGALVAALAGGTSVLVTALLSGLAGALVGLPLVLAVAAFTIKRGHQMSVETIVREREMHAEARRREFDTRLGRALEMSDDEDAAFDVVGRAMRVVAPAAPIEMLLADNSHAHLERVVTVMPDGAVAGGCAVDSPDGCVAARRAQVQVFHDSEDLDACPMLRGRDQGRCSAVCVPVSIMGRTVGVVHATGPVGTPLADDAVQELQTLANQAGNRLGMLRVMAETQLQASTDGLTGLINRRSLENAARRLRADGVPFALVMADLDHFKSLNDAHGHETGDRALRIFSETVRTVLRSEDLACRYGGEEFAIVLPGVDVHDAVDVIERIRQHLSLATGRGDAPAFTASFGVTHSDDAPDFDELMARADSALFAAKDAGRDRICLDGHATPIASTLAALG
jgi:diguanylate cyclase (GGDEF)-like protein